MKSIGKTLAKHKPTLFSNISKAFAKNENALARPKSAITNGHIKMGSIVGRKNTELYYNKSYFFYTEIEYYFKLLGQDAKSVKKHYK